MDSTGCLLCFFDHRCLLLDWFVDRVLWRAKKQNAREGAFFTTQSQRLNPSPFQVIHWEFGSFLLALESLLTFSGRLDGAADKVNEKDGQKKDQS
ncbi:hypothetical protein RO3G_13895 [Rhizopus delemar RA 99-880]|uniref:Uncharacterized protein n=1 Tax=Rhizopus delemar (strain RA 99-880 / ATCC MYA-4621 / FGSC 9543 / NRRL 43880) TaxID=246409 RepID=I1CL54_RHIO9|nr:hypothetical protein RO3G_13895 [Rhizopus delemar RA 99-880]|eukprot:EIE89184.1 hypothetical protein RO3G_13895 [Rhizopus delemar RA 99-880]